jgi:hypothetical protein
MIFCTRLWNDKSCYYVQTNNPTEELGRKLREELADELEKIGVAEDIIKAAHVRSALQSCGPEAAVGCLAVLGHPTNVYTPGIYQPQPGEILMDWFHEERNYSAMRQAFHEQDPAKVVGNRWPQWYPLAVSRVFGVRAEFNPSITRGQVIRHLKLAGAAQVCLIAPGHYIALVAYNDERDEIIFNDPWPDRFPDGNGFNRRMSAAEWSNVKSFAVLYF